MLNTGCVRNGVVRASAGGYARLDGAVGRRDRRRARVADAAANTVDDRRDVVDVVVSSSAMLIVAVVAVAEVDPRRQRRARGSGRDALRHARTRSVSKYDVVQLRDAERRELARRAAARSACTRARDRRQALRAVIDRVERRRCSPAAPARCRCSTSPSRGGCAARASAAPCGTRVLPCASTDTPMMRPGAWRT